MQCAYCGSNLNPGDKVCPQCGADVASVQAEPIPEAFPSASVGDQADELSEPEPVPEPAAPALASFSAYVSAAEQSAPNKRSILAIASLVIGVLSVSFSFFALCLAPLPVIGIIVGISGLRSPGAPWPSLASCSTSSACLWRFYLPSLSAGYSISLPCTGDNSLRRRRKNMK